MSIIEKIKALFTKKQPEEVQLQQEEIKPKEHDYQLGFADFMLRGGDYGWTTRPYKKVTLVNVEQCRDHISVLNLASAWRGTGHAEWEFLLALWLTHEVVDAIKLGKAETDISRLFDKDFTCRTKSFSREEVHKHILPYFDIISSSDTELRVALRLATCAA